MNSISQWERRTEDIRKWAQADEPRSVQVLSLIFIACILAYQECLQFSKISKIFQILHLYPNCWFFKIPEIFKFFLKKKSKLFWALKAKFGGGNPIQRRPSNVGQGQPMLQQQPAQGNMNYQQWNPYMQYQGIFLTNLT